MIIARPVRPRGSRDAQPDRQLAIVAPSAVRSLQTLLRSPGELAVAVQRLGCSYTERLLDFLETRSWRKHRMLEAGTLENVVSLVAPATPDRSRGATAHFVDYLSARPPAR